MVNVGRYNTLRVVKEVDFGVYLDGGDGLEILLPTRYVPENCNVDDEIEVFIYHDNEGRLIATTARPYAQVGEFDVMDVRNTSSLGAFIDWGIMKDILVPFGEQNGKMREGGSYFVHVYLDEKTGRVVASARIGRFLSQEAPEYQYNERVDLLVAEECDMGYKVIINNKHLGLLYRNEVFTVLMKGDRLFGYIKEVRPDGKIDVSMHKLGYGKVDTVSERILESLRENDGYLEVNDKTEAGKIYAVFGCSKKAFKQALGSLYKQHLIRFEEDGIELVDTEDETAD